MTEAPITPVILRFGPYRLDGVRDSDIDAVAAALTDPDVAQWNPGPSRPGTPAHERARLWVVERATWTADHASWGIRDIDDVLIGQVSIHQIDAQMHAADIGYWMTPAGRGRGIATAAVDTATRFGFEVLGLARLQLFHALDNPASCRVAIKCGYLVEGTTRQSFVYGDGLRHDEHIHARLLTDPPPGVALPS